MIEMNFTDVQAEFHSSMRRPIAKENCHLLFDSPYLLTLAQLSGKALANGLRSAGWLAFAKAQKMDEFLQRHQFLPFFDSFAFLCAPGNQICTAHSYILRTKPWQWVSGSNWKLFVVLCMLNWL
jgi:hypothetical protein